MQRTCGCRLNKGFPCSNLIPLEKYVCHRSEASALTRDQLDLLLMGAVMSVLNSHDESEDKSHKSKSRERIYSTYLFGGQRVCRCTYQFLLGVGKDRLQAIKATYIKDGITTRTHGNTKRLPHNALTYEDITRIVTAIMLRNKQYYYLGESPVIKGTISSYYHQVHQKRYIHNTKRNSLNIIFFCTANMEIVQRFLRSEW